MKGVRALEDRVIVQMYWDRNQDAIEQTSKKYGAYCTAIASNILEFREDVEECVNDTYLGAWNSMPPHRPSLLSTFLGKITRNLAFNRHRYNKAQKRSGNLQDVLTELGECVSESPEQMLDARMLGQALNSFLATLPERKRNLLICRYWYADSIGDIARRFFMTEGAVTMQLKRLRQQLRSSLEERGVDL